MTSEDFFYGNPCPCCKLSKHDIDNIISRQRESCADAVIVELKSIGFQIYESGEDRIREACLNATGESDGR